MDGSVVHGARVNPGKRLTHTDVKVHVVLKATSLLARSDERL